MRRSHLKKFNLKPELDIYCAEGVGEATYWIEVFILRDIRTGPRRPSPFFWIFRRLSSGSPVVTCPVGHHLVNRGKIPRVSILDSLQSPAFQMDY